MVESFVADPHDWAALNFGGADLGDERRTRRLVKLAAARAADPAGSIPRQLEGWADVKAAYRLFDQKQVTFSALSQAHWDLRQGCGPGRFLVLMDTSELDFGKHRALTGVGPTGTGSGRGFLLHSGLMVDPQTGHPQCVAGALLVTRQPKRQSETAAQRRQRPRESQRWRQLIDQIGPPPEGAEWIHVMDREADNFEIFAHCRRQRTEWVVRARTMTRRVRPERDAPNARLQDLISTWPVQGHLPLSVPAKAKTRREPARQKRQASLELRWGHLWMPAPKMLSSDLQGEEKEPLRLWVVQAREIDPPPGQKPVEWVLYTSLPVTSLEQALEVLEFYSSRWTIEEWHKGIKSGTRIKASQLATGDRLAPLIALSTIEALRLLQLKTIATTDPERPASEVVPPEYVQVLIQVQRLRPQQPLTVRDFFRGVARLGGFLARRGDGEPGWQTTWHGWEKLALLIRGHNAALTFKQAKCG